MPVRPYEAIWSNNLGNYHRSTALMALLFLVLLLYPIQSQEKQTDMEVHLRTSHRGRQGLHRRKTLLCALMAFLVWLVTYGFELLHTVKVYGSLMGLQAPMGVLMDFPGWKISMGAGLVIYYGLKLLVLLSAAFVIRLLSGLVKSNRNALLLNLLILLLPAVLVTLGVEAASPLSFLKPLGTAEVFFETVPFVVVLASGIAALLLRRN